MNVTRRTILVAVALLALMPMLASAQPITPPTISYQGRITVEGVPYDGQGYLKFAIVNHGGEVTWSNDGTSAGQPATGVPLAVTEGLFSVGLGDEDLGMVPLGRQAFADPASSLRVWFSADGGEYVRLAPDRPLTTVPFAYIAELANAAIDADTVDGKHANAFATSAHNHLNQSWSGNGMGLVVTSSDNIGIEGASGGAYQQTLVGEIVRPGILGTASASSGKAVGVHGRAENSPDGIGVYGTARTTGAMGVATSPTGRTRGLYGESVSPQGAGVYGKDAATTGGAAGVVGESDSPTGAGVAGYADHTSGQNYGVYGMTQSGSGHGVYGLASALSGTTYGLYGKAPSLSGRGVYGEGGYYGLYGLGTDLSGISYGVFGKSDSNASQASGVYGVAGAGQGTVYGVRGQATASGLGIGVYGEGIQAGVHGRGTGGETYGVLGEAGSSRGAGVYGTGSVTGTVGVATLASGTTYGVYGRSESSGGYGIYSDGDAHVQGSLTWQAKTSYLSVAPAAFRPRKNDIDYTNTGDGLFHSPGSIGHPSDDPLTWKWFYAPVSLPHGARIVSVKLHMQNGERPTGGEPRFSWVGQLELYRSRAIDADVDTLAELSAQGEFAAWQLITRSTAVTTFASVDNSQYVYFLKLAMLPLNGTTALHGVIIEYQTSEPH